MRKPAWISLLVAHGMAMMWLGCTSTNHEENFNYLRSASDFSVDTAGTDALCNEPQPAFGNDVELCKRTKKFVLHWERPEDTADFLGYRIYLDTTPPVATPGQHWNSIRNHAEWATLIISSVSKTKDSLVFFLTDHSSGHQDTIN